MNAPLKGFAWNGAIGKGKRALTYRTHKFNFEVYMPAREGQDAGWVCTAKFANSDPEDEHIQRHREVFDDKISRMTDAEGNVIWQLDPPGLEIDAT